LSPDGKLIKTVRHQDLFDLDVRELVEQHKISRKEERWVRMGRLIKNYSELQSSID